METSGSRPAQATEDEIEELRRRLKQVEMERDILKKALSMCVRRRPACSVGDETDPPGKESEPGS